MECFICWKYFSKLSRHYGGSGPSHLSYQSIYHPGLLVPILLSITWTCSYPSLYPYPGPLRPVCTHQTWYHLGLLISIILSITQACSYPLLYPYLGLLKPVYIHWIQCHPGLLVPIVYGNAQACLCPLYLCPGLLGPAHIHHIQCHLGLPVPIRLGLTTTQACSYPTYSVIWCTLRPTCTHCTHFNLDPFTSNSHSVACIFGPLCYLQISIPLRPTHLSWPLYTSGPFQAIHTNWVFCNQACHALQDKVAIWARCGALSQQLCYFGQWYIYHVVKCTSFRKQVYNICRCSREQQYTRALM